MDAESRSEGRWSTAIAVAMLLLASGALLFARLETPRHSDAPAAAELEPLGRVPRFTLTAQDGRDFGSAQLQGRVWIANVIFTRCGTICPRLTAETARLQLLTADMGANLHVVSITADPAHDTAEVLRRYARAHEADPRRWTFLTGERSRIESLVREGLRIHVADEIEDPEDVDISHSPHFVLLDHESRVRGYYDSNEPDAILRLSRDARRLVQDLPRS